MAGDSPDVGLPIDQHENPLRAKALEHHTGSHRMATLEFEACAAGEERREVRCSDILDFAA